MLFRKKLILFGLESSYNTDPTLTGSANAILTKNLAINTFQGNKAALNYDRPYLAADKQLYTGPYTTISFDVDLAGSGTAGAAPGYAPLLKACGFTETVNATAVTGTADAGTTGDITLDSMASASDDAYNRLLITITGGTGSGQVRRITDYVGSTKVASVYPAFSTAPDDTSTYSIGAQTVYSPVSDDFDSGYGYFYIDGELHKLAGTRGTVVCDLSKESLPAYKFTFTALRVPAASGSNPTPNYTAFVEPLPVNDTHTPELMIHDYAARTESLSFDVSNTVTYRNVVNGENVLITDRDPKMSITIEKPDLADKNFDAIIAAHTAGGVYVVHGISAGNIVRLDAPRVQLFDPGIQDSDGLATQSMNGSLLPSDAGDDEFFITLT